MAARLPPAVSMRPGLLDNLAVLSRKEAPRETCALLIGAPVAEGEDVVVSGALPVTNASETPETAFDVPSDDLIGAYKTAEESGLAIVGIFHSHPTSAAVPSETDRRMMAVNPVAWVVYSIRDDEARAWAIDGGGGGEGGPAAAEIRLDPGRDGEGESEPRHAGR